MQSWYSVVFSLCLLQTPQHQGHTILLVRFVKNFSATMRHRQTVRLFAAHIYSVFKWKIITRDLWKKEKKIQPIPQFLSHFCCSSLQTLHNGHSSRSIHKSISSNTYRKLSLNPLWQFFFHGCVLVMYLQ